MKATKILLILLISALLQACVTSASHRDGPPPRPVNLSQVKEPVPKYEPKSRYGNPKSYVALGRRYFVLNSAEGYDKRGIASWYGSKFHGQLTSSREPYSMYAMTAASPDLPIPSYVRVTNLENGRSAIVRVNDRGPFAANRIIDLSYAAAAKLGYAKNGTALVEVRAINMRNPNATPPTVLTARPQLYLQVGAFAEYTHANHLRRELSRYTTKPIRITRNDSGKRTIYRVQIGPLIGVGESDSLFNKLNKHGLNTAMTVIG
ncbi:MAG: septal ring lytic transglycosylase RlpA family protein [Coxiellaceae bacterium]|nr:septal ring lytic transglycosylase RlpA family protein [Coxiellaceae bacterium]